MKIFIWNHDNNKTQKSIKNIHKIAKIKKDEGYKIDFEKLRSMNSDVVAQIKINNTEVDYPVVKTTDNDYYLNYSFDKSHNDAGWIFMNHLSKFDVTDKNITIFGYARLDGSMFVSVKNMLTSEWQSNPDNYEISIYTDNTETKYRVFSTYIIKVEEYYLKESFNNDQEYQTFIESLK